MTQNFSFHKTAAKLILITVLIALVSGELVAQTESDKRPKVGVVLSGGSAKGIAHIGVLKVIEEAGIPIDYIAGTSMRSIIGGLYSVGYGADNL